MNHDIEQLQTALLARHKQLKEAKRDLRSAETKLKYSPDRQDLKDEVDLALDTIGELEVGIGELQEEIVEAERMQRIEAASKLREQAIEESDNLHFAVPDDDPILACQMLAAVAERLQYQYCSMQGYYESLIGKVYLARRFGEDGGHYGGTDDPAPEISRSDIDELDRIEKQRGHILSCRFAVERSFRKAEENIPADSSYRPVLLRKNDEQRAQELADMRERRWQQQREQQKAAKEVATSFHRDVDLTVYRPGSV